MSPDEELALLIANRLIEEGFVDPARHDTVSSKLATGTATIEDWRLWIELGPKAQQDEASDAQD